MQCDGNARCDYDAELDATACVCNDGYLGDGFKCILESDFTDGTSLPGCQRPSDCSDGQTCVIVPERASGRRTSEVLFEFRCIATYRLQEDSSEEESSEEDSSEEKQGTTRSSLVYKGFVEKNLGSIVIQCYPNISQPPMLWTSLKPF